jgi:hypothetical protein
VALCLTPVAQAAAQTPRSERPYRGLFGGRVDNPEHLLTLKSSAGGGYDTNVLLDSGGFGSGTAPDPRVGKSSSYGDLEAGLTYAFNTTRVGIGASAYTSARYYTDVRDEFAVAHSGSVAATLQLTKSTRVAGNFGVSYQPFLSLFAIPGLFDPALGQTASPNFDFGVASQDNASYTSGAEVTQDLSKRASLTVSYADQRTNYGESDNAPVRVGPGDVSNETAAVRFSYQIGRGLGAHYAGQRDDVRSSLVDAGIDFNRALSLSRRTTLTFATGSSFSQYQNQTYYRFLGNARLQREIGRTWSAALAYNRTLDHLAAYSRPVLGDAVTIGVGGLFNRRLQFDSSVGAFFGNVGFSGAQNAFKTYTAASALTVGLSRNIGIRMNYSYFRYFFEPDALPDVDLPTQEDRHSVQASIVLSAPLFYRARKSNVTR